MIAKKKAFKKTAKKKASKKSMSIKSTQGMADGGIVLSYSGSAGTQKSIKKFMELAIGRLPNNSGRYTSYIISKEHIRDTERFLDEWRTASKLVNHFQKK